MTTLSLVLSIASQAVLQIGGSGGAPAGPLVWGAENSLVWGAGNDLNWGLLDG